MKFINKQELHKLVPYLGIPADNPDYERDVYIDAKTSIYTSLS